MPADSDFVNQLAHRHRNGASGFETCAGLSLHYDEIIRTIVAETLAEQEPVYALFAIGGFGRGELCFHSDIDLLFFVPEFHDSPVVKQIEVSLQRLSDTGLSIGHTVRTISEIARLNPFEDISTVLSFLDSRFLTGDSKLVEAYHRTLATLLHSRPKRDLVSRIFSSVRERHAAYGDSAQLLEPNIKNSSGGLRDIHTIRWVLTILNDRIGDAPLKMTRLPRHRLFPESGLSTWGMHRVRIPLLSAYDALLRIRNELHLSTGSLHDTLEFSLQPDVAEHLGYRSGKTQRSVERFMKDYFRHARFVARSLENLEGAVRERVYPQLDKKFVLRTSEIRLRRKQHSLTSAEILQAIMHSIRNAAPLSHTIEGLVNRQLRSIRPLSSPEESALFRELLSKPGNIAPGLRRLSELGVLQAWIPEWELMVGFFQHNVYHFYTADEHTIRLIEAVEGLKDSQTRFGTIYRQLKTPEVLHCACLLHDIAKPLSVEDHEKEGARLSEKLAPNLGFAAEAREIAFLVRHHLLMEQIAFRRDLADPKTILDFTAHFESPTMLDYLLLLTYADLSAVNKRVWTDWKGSLLLELYDKSAAALRHKITSEDTQRIPAPDVAVMVEEVLSYVPESVTVREVREHLEDLRTTGYSSQFTSGEIGAHILALHRQTLPTSIADQREHHTDITFITRDAPYLLSKLCGLLSSHDANILGAQIFTKSNGFVIDRFRVVDTLTHEHLRQDVVEALRHSATAVLSEETTVERLLARQKNRWKRRTTRPSGTFRTEVEFEEHPRYLIIDVTAPDMIGILYVITRTLSQLGLSIATAKISTRLDGIIDSFYVSNTDGTLPTGDERLQHIKDQLLERIQLFLTHGTYE